MRTQRKSSRRSVSIASIERLESRRLLAVAGSLDSSFSTDGRQTVDFNISASDVAVQADGKTVIVGTHTGTSGETRFAVSRLNVDGTLDFGFGNSGLVLTQLSDLGHSRATAVAIQPDGKIVVVGEADVSAGFNEQELAAARYNIDGSLDTTFDGNGVLSRDLSGADMPTYVVDVAIQPNGQIVIVGHASPGTVFTDTDFYAAYYSVGGVFRGVTRVNFSTFSEDDASGATLDNLGRILITGTTFRDSSFVAALTRLTTFELPPELGGGVTASVDFKTTFAVPGRVFTFAEAVLAQPDGKTVIAGHTQDFDRRFDFFVARFTAAGDLDTTFGPGGLGFNVTDVGGDDRVGGIAATPALGVGGFIVTGNSSGMAAVKYTDNGLLDTSFGSGGKVRLSFGGTARVAPWFDRRLVLAGGNAFATARLLLGGARGVSAGTGDSVAIEGTTNTATLFVARTERLPFPTRVFFNISGTASMSNTRTGARDWSMPGMVITSVLTPTLATGYVDIPANETFVVRNFTPINDSLQETTETATFTIVSNSQYEIGSPASGTISIRDDDTPNNSIGATTVAKPPKQVGVGQELQAAVTWTVPTGGWRQLSSVQLRLRNWHDDDALAILTFDEATNSFSVESTPGAGNSPVSLVPEKCAFQAAGPAAPTVTVIFTFVFNAAAAGERFRLDIAARNDADAFSGFAEIGELHVHKKPKHDLA